MKFERRTQKLYYEDFFLSEAAAKIVKVGPDYIELDATVAYPEGGGQEADQGTISLAVARYHK
jgi:alanyl-tRNA synthetase